jgi:hypothetical protein
MTDEEAIDRTATHLLRVLEAPVAGRSSIKVLHRPNAERIVTEAIRAVWNASAESPTLKKFLSEDKP